jgi:hypothetical protein
MLRPAIVLAAASLASPAYADGQIGTIERGDYVCEMPGDAESDAGVEQSHENFTILNSSRYQTAEGSGTYLRRGDRLTMTSGPRNGDSYQVVSDTFLRKIENGRPGRLRCVRSNR